MAIFSKPVFGDDPSAVVLAQDQCMTDGVIERAAWRRTVYVPMWLISDGRTHVIEDEAQFDRMISDLECYAQARGITRIRTRILSNINASDNIATISGFRDHLAGEERRATASMTFTVIRAADGFRISQIHFNDDRADLSAMTQILRQSGAD